MMAYDINRGQSHQQEVEENYSIKLGFNQRYFAG
jgi:hypothetical protein